MAATDFTDSADSIKLTDAQRREARKQRIVEKSEKRMAAILNADGEKRQAPCIDGASNLASSSGSHLVVKEPEKYVTGPTSSKVLNFTDETPTNVEELLCTAKPKYIEFVDKTRFWLAVSMGIVLALCTLFCDQIGNIILPILLLVGTYEALVFKTKKLLYPRNQLVASAVSAVGFNSDVVLSIGLILEIIWEIGIDTLLAAFGFVITRLLLSNIIPLFYE